MPKSIQIKESFVNTDFSSDNRREFESCEFKNCVFSDFSNFKFSDCVFKTCNLSNLKTQQAIMQNCEFIDCKLLGLNFSGSKEFVFEVHFENCNLDYASFDKKKMNKSSFKNCKLHHANFTEADLSRTTLFNCDFYESVFSGTNVSGVDFTSSINFIIDPERNKIKKAKFSLQSLPGLLYSYDIVVQ